MAKSIVQSRVGKSAATVTNYALAYTSNIAVGNLLAVVVQKTGGITGNTVTDSRGNTWTAQTQYTDSSNGVSVQIFWAVANSSGACTVTVTTASGTPSFGLYLFEVNDSANGTWAVDGTPTGNNAPGTTPNASVGTMTVLADSFALCDAAIFGGTATAGTGWTLQTTQSVGFNQYVETQTSTSAGTLNGNFVDASSVRYCGAMSAWKATATNPAPGAAQLTLTGNLPGRMDLGITARTTVKGLT